MFIKPDDLYIDRITMLNESKEYLSNKGAEHARILPQGSVLVTCIGIIGKVGILKQEMAAFNQQINAIIPDKNIVNEKYLAYKIWNDRKKLQHIANAPLVPIINKKQFSEFKIDIPSLDYQLKVVDVLDKAQELIDKRKAQIEALDQLTQSVFLEMFGDPDKNTKQWNVYKLKEVVDKNCSISYGIVQPGDDVPDGVPIVRPVDIQQGIISVDNLKRTAKHISDAYSRTILKGCELLLTVRGTVGASYLVDESFKGVNVTRGITPLLFNEKIVNPIYIFHLFKTEQYQRKFKSLAKGITLLQINLIDLRELTLPVPPITVQNEFSKFVKKITIQKKKLQNSLNEMETIFNSLMQRAFKGELFNEQ